MKIEKYDPQKFPEVCECKWFRIRQGTEQNARPCEMRFVVCDHGRLEGFCKHHLALEMEENYRLRAALLAQLAEKILD